LRRSASGENELEADQLFGSIEQQLFSQALSMAEKRASPSALPVVAAKRFVGRILRAATSLQSSTMLWGVRPKESNEEQARQSVKPGKTWRSEAAIQSGNPFTQRDKL